MKYLALASFVFAVAAAAYWMISQEDNPGLDPPALSGPPGTVVFSGGHETDPRDNGRPVALIAAALGVKPQVFRDAFSGVTPAHGGHPSEAEAKANKQVLLDALGKHGITNERLDEVSDYYRYNRGGGETWRRTPATAQAVIENGEVIRVKIVDPGAGYLTPPTVRIAGYEEVKVQAKIEFSQDFQTNGRVIALKIVK